MHVAIGLFIISVQDSADFCCLQFCLSDSVINQQHKQVIVNVVNQDLVPTR